MTQTYGGLIMKSIKLDVRMSLYSMIIGIACVLLRMLMSPEIPNAISLSVCMAFTVLALILSAVEVKSHFGFFYSFAENWNGGGIINSGFLMGLGAFFFSANPLNSIIWLLAINLVLMFERTAIGSAVKK